MNVIFVIKPYDGMESVPQAIPNKRHITKSNGISSTSQKFQLITKKTVTNNGTAQCCNHNLQNSPFTIHKWKTENIAQFTAIV
jgi:hypothetical protein